MQARYLCGKCTHAQRIHVFLMKVDMQQPLLDYTECNFGETSDYTYCKLRTVLTISELHLPVEGRPR